MRSVLTCERRTLTLLFKYGWYRFKIYMFITVKTVYRYYAQ